MIIPVFSIGVGKQLYVGLLENGLTKFFFYTRPAFSKMANNIGRKSRIGFCCFCIGRSSAQRKVKSLENWPGQNCFYPTDGGLKERKLEMVYHTIPEPSNKLKSCI
jgi:hypothetical protein